MNVLVTGASGFIGRALCQRLVESGHDVSGIVRDVRSQIPNVKLIELADLEQVEFQHLVGVDIVFHVAGLAHQRKVDVGQFHRVNVICTRKIAKACVEAKVGRLIYISSTKAVSEGSVGPLMKPNPESDYGESKRQGELEVLEIAGWSQMQAVVVRIPLTFGVGVKGNFRSLVQLAAKRIPIPLAALGAMRSFLGLENLMEFLELCMTHNNVVGRCVLVCDSERISLGKLIEDLSKAQGNKLRLINISEPFLRSMTKYLLPRKVHRQLFEHCLVDISETIELTGWQPKYSTTDGVYQMFGQFDEA